MMSDQLPEGWVWTTLGKATQPMQRRVNPQDYPEMPYIGMENVEAHTMQLLGTVPARQMKSLADSFIAGDVLYGRLRPYLNKVLCPDFSGLCSTEFIVFRQVPHIYSKYLQYFLNSWEFVTFSNSLNAGDRPRVKFEQFADYPFPLPPLAEQERIVAKIEALFSQLDAGVAALRRIQAALKRYKASVLKAACEGRLVPQDPADEPAEALLHRLGKAPLVDDDLPPLPEGWCWVRVGDIASHRLGKMLDKEKNKGVLRPYIRNLNVRWFAFDLSDIQYMRVMDSELENVSAKKNDLIVCEGGEPGRAAVWMQDTPIIIQKALHRVRPVEGVSPKFLAICLASDASSGLLERYFTGSTIKHFTGESLHDYFLRLPPSQEQSRIVNEVEWRLSIADEVEAVVAALLARSARLRQAILKQAFEGKLV